MGAKAFLNYFALALQICLTQRVVCTSPHQVKLKERVYLHDLCSLSGFASLSSPALIEIRLLAI